MCLSFYTFSTGSDCYFDAGEFDGERAFHERHSSESLTCLYSQLRKIVKFICSYVVTTFARKIFDYCGTVNDILFLVIQSIILYKLRMKFTLNLFYVTSNASQLFSIYFYLHFIDMYYSER